MENLRKSNVLDFNFIAFKYGRLATSLSDSTWGDGVEDKSVSSCVDKQDEQLKQALTEQLASYKECISRNPNDIVELTGIFWTTIFPKKPMLDLYFHFRKDMVDKHMLNDNYVNGILSDEEEKYLLENIDELKKLIDIISGISNVPCDFPQLISDLMSTTACNSGRLFVTSNVLSFARAIKGSHIVGVETEADILAFNLMIAEEEGLDIQLYQSYESMIEHLGQDIQFDAIIAVEPGTCKNKVDESFLKELYTKRLADNGVLFAPVRSSYISQQACKDANSFMYDMIEQCSIKSIIQLPTYYWKAANESVSLVWIGKTINADDSEMDKASASLYKRQRRAFCQGVIMVRETDHENDEEICRDNILQNFTRYKRHYDIKEEVQDGCFSPSDSQEVTYDRIDKSGGILLPEYYLSQYIENEEILGEEAEVSARISEPAGKPVCYVREAHFSDVATGIALDVESLAYVHNAKSVVSGPVVIVRFDGSKVKTAIIDADVDVAIDDDMFAFSAKCNPAYLECLFHEMALKVCTNRDYPLTAEIILAQIVKKRNEDEQVGYMLRTLGTNVQNLERRAKAEYDNYQREIHMRRHALSQTVSALSADWKCVINGLNRTGCLNLSDTLGRLYPIKVSDLVRSISEKIDVLGIQTKHLAEVECEWAKPEPINVADYLAKYTQRNQSDRFRYDPDSISDLHKWSRISINATTDALNRVLDSIISNALSHGFTDKTRTDYSVRFRCKPDNGKIHIFIDNNGCSLPEWCVGREDSLKMYGVSTSFNKDGHSGIGCFHAETIVKHFGGSMTIKSIVGDHDGYTVSYVLEFPIVK